MDTKPRLARSCLTTSASNSSQQPNKALRVGLIVPTLNGGTQWVTLLKQIRDQSLRPVRRLVIDSSSDDSTVALASNYGFEVVTIDRSEFDHGGTRQQAAELLDDCDILIYLTQDVLLAGSDSLSKLISAFDDPKVAVAYGRQLPHEYAGSIASHARIFNYPARSMKKTAVDIPTLGIKTAFCSNSFAAYRRTDLMATGGFAKTLIFGEDTHLTTRLLLSGHSIHYMAEATVFHSHNYSLGEDFRRYFDIGVFHSREYWILDALGKAEGEGLRFIRSELGYLLIHTPWLIPSALLRTLIKYIAYKLGRSEAKLSIGQKRRLSLNRRFWKA
jgi:rhamnosyltransferase